MKRQRIRHRFTASDALYLVQQVPAWFYLAPVITFFVAVVSFGSAGV